MKLKKVVSIFTIASLIGSIFMTALNSKSYAESNDTTIIKVTEENKDSLELNYGGKTIIEDGDVTLEINHDSRNMIDENGKTSRVINTAKGSRSFVVKLGESVVDTYTITMKRNLKSAVKTKATVTYKPVSETKFQTIVKLNSATPYSGFTVFSKSSTNGSKVGVGSTSTGKTTVGFNAIGEANSYIVTGSFGAKVTNRTSGSSQSAPQFFINLNWNHTIK